MVGGGALFFHLCPRDAYLSDVSEELMNCFSVVKQDVSALIRHLGTHVYSPEHYYAVRNADRQKRYASWSKVRKAARVIYLNKTCFNGLYRVNSKGHFNTPFGAYVNPRLVDEKNLRACSAVLKRARLVTGSFELIESETRAGDFVYFDPPYVPLNRTSDFTAYTPGGFGLEMQVVLRDLCARLDRRKVKFMVSNSSAPLVRELYQAFHIAPVQSARSINSKGAKRGKIEEVIITNYSR